eukprot:scaffold22312_cov48-Attheya_sp.AAC.1
MLWYRPPPSPFSNLICPCYRYRYRGASRISDISTNADSTAMWRRGGIYRIAAMMICMLS